MHPRTHSEHVHETSRIHEAYEHEAGDEDEGGDEDKPEEHAEPTASAMYCASIAHPIPCLLYCLTGSRRLVMDLRSKAFESKV